VKVKALAFARYCELLGYSEVEISLPESSTLRELLQHALFVKLPSDALLAVNHRFVSRDEILCHGDEVAVMPPVSGG